MTSIHKLSDYREEFLEKLLPKDGSRSQTLGKIRNKWAKILPQYSQTVWPKKISNQTLVLRVANHLVYAEVLFYETKIYQAIQEIVQEPDLKIRFVLEDEQMRHNYNGRGK